MPDPNATPAPLTMTPADETMYREQMRDGRVYRIDRPSLVVLARSVFAELDATRAKLAEVTAARDNVTQYWGDSMDLVTDLRAKLAEAEAQRDADRRAHVVSMNAKHEMWEQAIALRDTSAAQLEALWPLLTAAESRVAALTEALTALDKACDLEPDCAVCGSSGHEEMCPRRVMVPAALSPSQDAKDGGAV